MKAWITKYALTCGIGRIECKEVGSGMIKDYQQKYPTYYHGEGREWHRTFESAVQKANDMKKLKIKALNKQIAKLNSIDFSKEG